MTKTISVDSSVSIFAQSFKGLPDGWHQIASINFLVGENSSGKTSMLDLLSILDTSEYHTANRITGAVDGINTAVDVISRLSGGTTVSVGYLALRRPLIEDSDGSDQRSSHDIFGQMTSYVKIKSILRLSRVTYFLPNVIIRLDHQGNSLYGKIYTNCIDGDDFSVLRDRLSDFHFNKRKDFKKILSSERPIGPSIWTTAMLQLIHSSQGQDSGELLSKIFLRRSPLNLRHYGPIRATTERFYHSGSPRSFNRRGSHYPFHLRRIAEKGGGGWEAVREFGRDSGLYDEIRFVKAGKSAGLDTFSLKFVKSGEEFFADELGYGVGQIVPIITDMLTRQDSGTIVIQQPEVHLHPRAQAAFGKFLYRANKKGGSIVIETHSDYLIDRFRVERSKDADASQSAQILFFKSDPDHRQNLASSITICPDGKLADPPADYRNFFISEEIDVFRHL